MGWIRLALKEWQRRPLRTAVTAVGVAIATAALFSLLAFQRGYTGGLRDELNRLGAHVLVVPKGCPYDAASMALHGATWPCHLKEAYLQEVLSIPGVAAAAPVLMTAVRDQWGDQVVYLGIDTNMLSLRPGWRIAGRFPTDAGALLAGADVAAKHAWVPGKEIALPGVSGQKGTLTGVLEKTHSSEDGFIYVPLKDAQKLFNLTNQISHILIRLADTSDLDRVVAQLRGCDAGLAMNVVPLAHVFRTIQSLVNSTRLLLGCIAAVALLVAATGVSNTVLIAVAERGREIGVMRALGASPRDIVGVIWLETVQVCFVGACVGVLGAWLASGAVEAWVRAQLPFAPVAPLIHWDWMLGGACIISSIVLGSLAASLPAWRAAQMPPIVAIRSGGGFA